MVRKLLLTVTGIMLAVTGCPGPETETDAESGATTGGKVAPLTSVSVPPVFHRWKGGLLPCPTLSYAEFGKYGSYGSPDPERAGPRYADHSAYTVRCTYGAGVPGDYPLRRVYLTLMVPPEQSVADAIWQDMASEAGPVWEGLGEHAFEAFSMEPGLTVLVVRSGNAVLHLAFSRRTQDSFPKVKAAIPIYVQEFLDSLVPAS